VNAKPPFDNVDLILATHSHADHFDAAMVRQHMQNDPNTIFMSTTQAVSQLSDLGERVLAADPVAGSPVDVEANGIQVEAIYLSHGTVPNPAVEIFNNGYVVTVDGVKFFHTGDIDNLWDVTRYYLADQNITLAFIPHFFLRDNESKGIIEDNIAARYLLPIHYQYTRPAFSASRIRMYYPGAIIFSAEMQNWFMPAMDNK
jgi:L-ascorbate metabolism protein UlaG (beta-lactamase superfamily)